MTGMAIMQSYFADEIRYTKEATVTSKAGFVAVTKPKKTDFPLPDSFEVRLIYDAIPDVSKKFVATAHFSNIVCGLCRLAT